MYSKQIKKLSFAIIGLALLAIAFGGCQTNSTANNKAASTNAKGAGDAYAKALPGANPPNSLGAANAPVTLEEFADFQCPTCGVMHPKVQEIRAAYGDRIRIIFRNFPLKIPAHDKAYEAAVAAESAGLQGKFWDMQNLLFTNQQTWTIDPNYRKTFEGYAQKLGLDVQKFNDDMAGLISKNRVDADLQRGNSLSVNSTPSFFVNGKPVQQADMTVEGMKKLIDAELQKVTQSSSQPAQPTQSTAANNNSAPANTNKPVENKAVEKPANAK